MRVVELDPQGLATGTSASGFARDDVLWHGLTSEEACARLEVDPKDGLDAAEIERRRAEVGPNKLVEAEKEPGWHAFLRQYRDLMQLVLVGAAIVSVAALQEFADKIDVTYSPPAIDPQADVRTDREPVPVGEDDRPTGVDRWCPAGPTKFVIQTS